VNSNPLGNVTLIETEEAMIAFGRKLARELPPRAVVFLIGNLGAGKTTLTKGIAEGLGAAKEDEVTSPTFTLIHEYGNPVRLYHIDLYRLDEPRQLATLGLDEIFDRDAMTVIEWPERFQQWLPPEHVTVSIKWDVDSRHDTRLVTVTPS
jgi:tRNA threonylcarbamoyladenosine biosynthesis protein TsaE